MIAEQRPEQVSPKSRVLAELRVAAVLAAFRADVPIFGHKRYQLLRHALGLEQVHHVQSRNLRAGVPRLLQVRSH